MIWFLSLVYYYTYKAKRVLLKEMKFIRTDRYIKVMLFGLFTCLLWSRMHHRDENAHKIYFLLNVHKNRLFLQYMLQWCAIVLLPSLWQLLDVVTVAFPIFESSPYCHYCLVVYMKFSCIFKKMKVWISVERPHRLKTLGEIEQLCGHFWDKACYTAGHLTESASSSAVELWR